MEILELNLVNFRNFAQKKIGFDPKLTVILGDNGSGKTNILEAVGLLCAVRPVRVETDLDLVRFSKTEAKVEGKFVKEEEEKTLIVNFVVVDERFIKKSFFIDAFKKRFIDFADVASIVVFHPQDLDLVSGSPSLRRHQLDSLLSGADRQYWRNISAYNKIVTRRNKVLARIFEGKSKLLELNFWDERLLEHASYVSKKRQEYFEFLNFVELMGPVTGSSHPTSSTKSNSKRNQSPDVGLRALDGTPSAGAAHRRNLSSFAWELRQSLVSEEKLLRNRERDIAARVTLSGPHRDDFRFLEKGRDLAFFGSRGEQRMAVLHFRLAQLEYLRKKLARIPILALDDIFSELDWEHREAVLAVVSNQQTIITAAEIESIPKNLLKKAKVVEL